MIAGMSLAKLQSFSCRASKKSSEENGGSKSQQTSGYKVKDSRKIAKDQDESEKRCEKTRERKDACEKQESKSESCKRYLCPEFRKRQCNWEREEKCPEERVKKDPKCSQKEDISTKCNKSKAERHNYSIIYLRYSVCCGCFNIRT